jgi:isoleucyl-tRNA synthetase
MTRSDLIDVWFDSGSMPMHNGIILENKDKIDENKDFPADLLQKVSIKRVVLYLHAIGTLVFDKVAYKKCSFKRLVLDKTDKNVQTFRECCRSF